VAEARGLLAALRSGRPGGETPFETVAEEAFRRHVRRWKPSTPSVNRYHLDRHVPPRFTGPVADITPRDVRDRFAAMYATPVSADRSMPVLSVIT